MPGIGIISNPYAKVNKRNPEHNTLMWYVLGNRGQFEVTRSLEDLSAVCREFQARDIDLVGLVGGDGTISLTLSALHQAYGQHNLPKIMILRGGTVNVLAGNLGIFGKPKDIMSDFLETYHAGKPFAEMKVHSLTANGRLGFLFANGAASKFLAEFYKNKSSSFGAGIFLSKVAADGVFGGAFGGQFRDISKPEKMVVHTEPTPLWANSASQPKEYSMVLAATIPKMPFGLHFYRSVDPSKPQGELVAIGTEGKALVSQAMRAIAGRKLTDTKIAQVIFDKAVIETDAGASYSLDGDLLETLEGKIVIEPGPAFVFCSPYGKVL